ncbi:MAG: ATPase [Bowdeniella nasicola]|nr:ATPase [Bowdeniella nasicola]
MTENRGANLTEILTSIEAIVREARAMPMSASVLVNRAELLDLLAAARQMVPGEIQRADATLRGADQTIASAREQAEHIRADAHRRAEELVSEQEIVASARRRARELESEAMERAEDLRRGAEDYCDRQLAELEVHIGRIQRQVEAGRAVLANDIEKNES